MRRIFTFTKLQTGYCLSLPRCMLRVHVACPSVTSALAALVHCALYTAQCTALSAQCSVHVHTCVRAIMAYEHFYNIICFHICCSLTLTFIFNTDMYFLTNFWVLINFKVLLKAANSRSLFLRHLRQLVVSDSLPVLGHASCNQYIRNLTTDISM